MLYYNDRKYTVGVVVVMKL